MEANMEDFIFETAIFKLIYTYAEKKVGYSDNKEYEEEASYLQVINDSIKNSDNEKELSNNLKEKTLNISESEYGRGAMASYGISKLEFLSNIEIEIILKRKVETMKRLGEHYFSLPFAI